MLWRMTAALPGRAVSTHTRFHQLLWPIGAWCFLSLLIVSPVWLLARACPIFLALLGPLRDGGAMLLFAAQRVVGRFAVEGCVAAWVAVGDRTWNCYKQTNKHQQSAALLRLRQSLQMRHASMRQHKPAVGKEQCRLSRAYVCRAAYVAGHDASN